MSDAGETVGGRGNAPIACLADDSPQVTDTDLTLALPPYKHIPRSSNLYALNGFSMLLNAELNDFRPGSPQPSVELPRYEPLSITSDSGELPSYESHASSEIPSSSARESAGVLSCDALPPGYGTPERMRGRWLRDRGRLRELRDRLFWNRAANLNGRNGSSDESSAGSGSRNDSTCISMSECGSEILEGRVRDKHDPDFHLSRYRSWN